MAYFDSAANSGYTQGGMTYPAASTNSSSGLPTGRRMATSPGCGVICGTPHNEQPILTYVGLHKGDYVQETTYKYVGNGKGEFGVVDNQNRTNWCCMCLGIVGLLWLLVFAAMMIWPSVYPAAGSAPVQLPAGQAAAAAAPAGKPKPAPAQTFDCVAGFANWEQGWSAAKKTWCCQHARRGCPLAPPPPPDPYDCAHGFDNWQAGWSPAKKVWCCDHHHRGCEQPGPAPPTSAPFDCNAGFANWQSGWSTPKKVWCCQHVSKGCPPHGG